MAYTWTLLVQHEDQVRVCWTGLRPRVEVKRAGCGLLVYKPKVSGLVQLGPLTAAGRFLTFGLGG